MTLVSPLTETDPQLLHHSLVRRGAYALVLCCLVATPAAAEDEKSLYDRLWPKAPDAPRLSLSQQVQDQISEICNQIGGHLDVLTSDMMTVGVDVRKRRAWVRVGGGDEQYLTFRLASDVLFTDGLARVNTRIDLAFRGRKLQLELPEMEMVPASYHGERGVEVRLPLLRRRF